MVYAAAATASIMIIIVELTSGNNNFSTMLPTYNPAAVSTITFPRMVINEK